MSRPKSHHYVPRFYLSRFADAKGKLSVLDKTTWSTYSTTLDNIACVNHFYVVPELQEAGLDPLLLEQQFSALESEVANITACWLRQFERGTRVEIPEINRQLVSQFMVLQMLRTVEARTLLMQFIEFTKKHSPDAPPVLTESTDERTIHAHLLWHDELVNRAVQIVKDRIWIFGKNDSSTLFCTSDHPVLIKSGDNRGWVLDKLIVNDLLREDLYDPASYFVYPLTPRWILYCHDRKHYEKMEPFDNQVSPVPFNADMVNHENSGQIGMSHRFIYSADGDFSFAEEFAADQPWIRDPSRNRFEEHQNPYEGGKES